MSQIFAFFIVLKRTREVYQTKCRFYRRLKLWELLRFTMSWDVSNSPSGLILLNFRYGVEEVYAQASESFFETVFFERYLRVVVSTIITVLIIILMLL